jgi:hypothetical protein
MMPNRRIIFIKANSVALLPLLRTAAMILERCLLEKVSVMRQSIIVLAQCL